MRMNYASAVDWMKKRGFATLVPYGYDPSITSDSLTRQTKVEEVINPLVPKTLYRRRPEDYLVDVDPDNLQDALCTPEMLINLYRRKVRHVIQYDADMPEILEGIDRYLLSIQNDVELSDGVSRAYARVVIDWRAEIYKHYFRYAKQNPNFLRTLYPNHDPNSTVFSLLELVSPGSDRDGYNPLKAKARPPYQIPSDQDNDPHVDIEVRSEMYLGVSEKLAAKYDDGGDFNFDDFLGRK